jgi:hypothetical protein
MTSVLTGEMVWVTDKSGEAETTVDKGIALSPPDNGVVSIYDRTGTINEYKTDNYGFNTGENILTELTDLFVATVNEKFGETVPASLTREISGEMTRQFLLELAETHDPTAASGTAVQENIPSNIEEYSGDLADVLLRTQDWMCSTI